MATLNDVYPRLQLMARTSGKAADNRVSSQLSWYEIGRNIVGGLHVF